MTYMNAHAPRPRSPSLLRVTTQLHTRRLCSPGSRAAQRAWTAQACAITDTQTRYTNAHAHAHAHALPSAPCSLPHTHVLRSAWAAQAWAWPSGPTPAARQPGTTGSARRGPWGGGGQWAQGEGRCVTAGNCNGVGGRGLCLPSNEAFSTAHQPNHTPAPCIRTTPVRI